MKQGSRWEQSLYFLGVLFFPTRLFIVLMIPVAIVMVIHYFFGRRLRRQWLAWMNGVDLEAIPEQEPPRPPVEPSQSGGPSVL